MRLVLAAVLLGAAPLAAQPAGTLAAVDFPARLIAGVTSAPPYAIKNADGTWDGIAVELWREIGRAEGFEAALREVPDGDLIGSVARGALDLALAARASAEDEARVDFALPYATATLGVARKRGSGIGRVLGRLFLPTFLKIALGLSVLLLLVGVLEWWAERDDNSEDFNEGKKGIWDGFWWAGVTMTTIGYGNVAPKTVAGRSIALVWMLVSMAVTAALTAALVSALGLGSGSGKPGSAKLPDDVRGKAVGVVEGSMAADYLAAERVQARPFASVEAGLRSVDRDSLDAFVAAAPVLKSALADSEMDELSVASTSAEPQQWAFAVPSGSLLGEKLGRAVLTHTRGPAWQATLERYGGGS